MTNDTTGTHCLRTDESIVAFSYRRHDNRAEQITRRDGNPTE